MLLSAMTTTIPQLWMRSPTRLAVVCASWSWMAHLHSCVLTWTMNPPSSQCSTPHGDVTDLSISPGPCLCPGHLSTDDGPNPGMLQRCNWDCRQCHHPWMWWRRAWPMPAHTHAGHQGTQACLQWWKMCHKQPSIKFFGWVYDKDSTHQDPSKVTAIHNMPAPEMPSNCRSSLALSLTCLPSCPLSPLQCPSVACWRRTLSSLGMKHTKMPLTLSRA